MKLYFDDPQRIPMSLVAQSIDIRVTLSGVRTWKVRVWLGCKLMVFAAFVIGCHVHVEV